MGGPIFNEGTLHVAPDAVLRSQMGGEVLNLPEGQFILDGVFECGCVRFDDEDHMWFFNDGGVDGAGRVVLYNALTGAEGGNGLADLSALRQDMIAALQCGTVHVFTEALVIIWQPGNYVGGIGEQAAFSVVAEGEGLTYQWYWRNAGKTKWNLSSDTDECYDSVELTEERNGREVYCVVTDRYGYTVTSQVATLTVEP
jgi:hypothetical protein